MFRKIIEFPVLVYLGACMILGPALPYVIGVIAAMFGLGIFIGVMF
jgi:hypothetical protein